VLQQIVDFCTSDAGLLWLSIASDMAIALAYFAIPLTMAVVLRDRKDDIPYPWLWTLFVVFIVACGLTHVVHVWAVFWGTDKRSVYVVIALVTAMASVGTAVAFAAILPQVKNIPSPRAQRALLEKMVATRTAEKDRLIREINHRAGNQLQIISSIVRIEKRRTDSQDAVAMLERLENELRQLNERHHEHSQHDFLTADSEVHASGEGAMPNSGLQKSERAG
jgi:hypothetical protein